MGVVRMPLSFVGKISVGLAAVLIAALVLGYLRRTGSTNWTIPLSATLVLRNLGLTLFLAQVGMASGPKFVSTITQTGILMLGLGAILTIALMLPILTLGLFVYRMPFDEVAGIIAGACGNPAVLAYTNRIVPTDKPEAELQPRLRASEIVGEPTAISASSRPDRSVIASYSRR
jgi:putative transport protein